MGNIKDDIRSGYIHSLTNKEFSGLLLQVFRSMEGEELKDEHLLKALTNAKRHIENIKLVGNATYKHKATEELDELILSRGNKLRSLRLSAEAAKRSGDSDKVRAGKSILFWMNPYKKAISQPAGKSQSHVVVRLQATKDDTLNKNVESSLEKIGCTVLFDEIIAETELIDTLIVIRRDEITSMRRDIREKRKAAYGTFKTFLSALVNLSNLPDDDQQEFVRLANKVEKHLDEYRAAWLSRLTAKRNRKEAENSDQDHEAVPNVASSEASEDARVAEDGDSANNSEDFSIK